jgi:Ni/Fe-hydrogenase 1 B-type cytochrome subunit
MEPQAKTVSQFYVFEGPVRLWHWINALSIVVLGVTGWFIASPLPSPGGEASENYLMGYLRFVHFAAGYIFAVGFLGRLYWAFAGNQYARQLFTIPVTDREFWHGMWMQIRWYLFLERKAHKHFGHNPLDQFGTFFLFTVTSVLLIVTGFALYGEGLGAGSWADRLFGWVIPLMGGSQSVHSWHHLLMWVMICYVIVHLYFSFREDIMSPQSTISTMVSGYRMNKE